MSRVFGLAAIAAGLLVILAGAFAAWTTRAVMFTYADAVPNTLAQYLMPLLLYVVPTLAIGLGLAAYGWGLWRRRDRKQTPQTEGDLP
ncbi:MAG: hypothetical protein ACK4MH_12945 [Brevundimonas sp.]|uniref:hypothetical protein n=1 Tax=Brevundimonas sp. TaxID=1871086 RepID=UPI00391BC688